MGKLTEFRKTIILPQNLSRTPSVLDLGLPRIYTVNYICSKQ